MRRELQPPGDREVFQLDLPLFEADFDENGHVNNVVYVRWLQDAGTAHWLARFDEATRANWSWVALRHEVDYFRPLLPGARARARTWVGTPQGPRFDRMVRIEDDQGRLCAQGVSTWCLVDAASMRPHRIPAEMLTAFQPTQ
ncbi:thioesterase family protein [Brevundimonas sp. 2R-24]|uniref:Thioesterase family protein n=1 Tax=Peiella sedimenti TaxID=3061083 RepID=A0ABT8SHZ0_9CAUL|nr:thioesterase family protein [Caulobacteraceae bacterium XZ-24]